MFKNKQLIINNAIVVVSGSADGHVNSKAFHGYITFEDPVTGKEVQVDGEFRFDFSRELVIHTCNNEDGSVRCEVECTIERKG